MTKGHILLILFAFFCLNSWSKEGCGLNYHQIEKGLSIDPPGHEKCVQEYYEKAIASMDFLEIGRATSLMASLSFFYGDLERATFLYCKAHNIFKSIHADADQNKIMIALSRIFIVMHDFHRAKYFQWKGLTYYAQQGDRDAMADILFNLGILYHSEQKFDSALFLLDKADQLCSDEDNLRVLSRVNMIKGFVFMDLGQDSLALASEKRALKYAKLFDDKMALSGINFSLGTIFMNMGEYDSAKIHLKGALNLSKEVRNPEFTGNSMKQLAEVYRRQDSLGLSNYYLVESTKILDTIKEPAEIANVSNHISRQFTVSDIVDRSSSTQSYWLLISPVILLLLWISYFVVKRYSRLEGASSGNSSYLKFAQKEMDASEIKKRPDLSGKGASCSIELESAEVQSELDQANDLVDRGAEDMVHLTNEHVISSMVAGESEVKYETGDDNEAVLFHDDDMDDRDDLFTTEENELDANNSSGQKLNGKNVKSQNADLLKVEIQQLQRELMAKTVQINQQKELIETTAKELKQISFGGAKGSHELKSILSTLRAAQSSANWDEFEMYFNEIHIDFFRKLNANFPELSINERRLCGLICLNLTNKEISQLTNRSLRAVEVAKYRLRKKMNLDQNDNIVSVLTKYTDPIQR